VIRPPAAAWSRGAGVTAEVTRPAAVRIVDSYPPDSAGSGPRWCHPGRGLPQDRPTGYPPTRPAIWTRHPWRISVLGCAPSGRRTGRRLTA